KIDGKEIVRHDFDYVVLHKPPGVVTTCDDEFGRESILDLLPESLQHLKPVGRLDLDSEGLLILTNDGALAYELTHPSKI
ncbi:pseudouridine synthase, partial [Acinetobacter baumannii]